jgi:glycosyltransferase involved in cell wall biosynthesis
MQMAGILFGSHTLNHTLLSNEPPSMAEGEIRDSRRELEDRIGTEPTGFAYPWGAVGRSSIDQVRDSGYGFAVTINPGLVSSTSDTFLLPRLPVSDSVLRRGQKPLERGKATLYFSKRILTTSAKRFFRKKSKNINKRVKILFVLDLITEWEGGTERQLRLLIKSLDPKYFEPKLCFLFEAPQLPEESLPCPLQTNSRTLWNFQNTVEAVPGTRIDILPNGTDVSRLVPATPEERRLIRSQLGLSETGPICVCVANLYQVKGLEALIHAAALLRAEFPSIQFLVVGEGNQRQELQSLATQLGVSELVRFVGRQPDVRPFLAAADIGVLTSHSEGSSNSVLEYMAMSLPSIVSDIPANRELLDEVIFKTGDATDLAEKILDLWRDEQRRSRLSKEYREIASQYSTEKFTDRAQSYYSRMASQI